MELKDVSLLGDYSKIFENYYLNNIYEFKFGILSTVVFIEFKKFISLSSSLTFSIYFSRNSYVLFSYYYYFVLFN